MEKRGAIEHRRLTNSLRNLWTGCHRRFYYAEVERLQPIVTAKALYVGTLVHAGLAEHYAAAMNERVSDIDGALELVMREYQRELERLDDVDAAQGALEDARGNMDLATSLIQVYLDAYRDPGWDILAIEHHLDMRLRTPKGTSSHWKYEGTLDLVVFDHGDNRVKIIDHKTTSKINKEKFIEEIMLDPQSPGYVMLLRDHPELTEEFGPVGDFVFNVIRSKLPAEPKTLICKKCNPKIKKGGEANPECPSCCGTNVSGLSVAQGVDTTVEKYRDALSKYRHLDIVDYAEVFERLEAKSNSWLYRVELNYTPDQIEDFHKESYEITRSISEARYWDRDFGSCFRQDRRCAYRFLCLAEGNEKVEEARAMFFKRETEYDDDSAESLMQVDELPF